MPTPPRPVVRQIVRPATKPPQVPHKPAAAPIPVRHTTASNAGRVEHTAVVVPSAAVNGRLSKHVVSAPVVQHSTSTPLVQLLRPTTGVDTDVGHEEARGVPSSFREAIKAAVAVDKNPITETLHETHAETQTIAAAPTPATVSLTLRCPMCHNVHTVSLG